MKNSASLRVISSACAASQISLRLLVLSLLAAMAFTPLLGCSDDEGGAPNGGGDTLSLGDTVSDTTTDTASTTADTASDTDSGVQDPCGDGTLDPLEQCEDGNRDDGDGCSSECVSEVGALVINEVASSPLPGEADWFELRNLSDATQRVGGWGVQDSDPTHLYTFPGSVTISPMGYLLLERGVTGSFDFGLGSGDALFLRDALGVAVDETSWVDGDAPIGSTWGRLPDGKGDFQTLYAPTPGAENSAGTPVLCGDDVIEGFELCDGESSNISCQDQGFAGGEVICIDCVEVAFDLCALNPAVDVRLNEVQSTQDAIELYNHGSTPVDLSGWILTDDSPHDPTHRMLIPEGTSLDAGAFLVFSKDIDFTFGLGGDDIVLLIDGNGDVVDRFDWLDGEAALSYCRLVDGEGDPIACAQATMGGSNNP